MHKSDRSLITKRTKTPLDYNGLGRFLLSPYAHYAYFSISQETNLIPRVNTGLEIFYKYPRKDLKGKRLGLLANPASVTSNLTHASQVIHTLYPGQLKALFSPQHGFHAEKQDNMIESGHSNHSRLGIPIYSLYSDTRIPTPEMFDLIDVLIIDIQDVGTRVYTFIYTISYCLEVAAKNNTSVIILDRPNPIGGVTVEGNLLERACASFVGRFPIPMRHGMTVGEIATLFNAIPNHLKMRFENQTSNKIVSDKIITDEEAISDSSNIHEENNAPHYFNSILDAILKRKKKKPCDLTVIPMEGWRRKMLFSDTTLPWIAPSPNLPTPTSALVYPGQVIWEGTNISEGRGTTQPFELFGAPFLDTDAILEEIADKIDGAILRPAAFQPTSGKWCGEVCRGFQIHVHAPSAYRPYQTSLLLLQAIIKQHPDQFQWKQPPYEYEHERLPIDLILGDVALRKSIDIRTGSCVTELDTLVASWNDALLQFQRLSQEFHLYV